MTKFKLNRLEILIAASFATLVATTGQALAQSPDADELISRADLNGDGDISWEEVLDMRANSFERLDRNSDGVVSKDDSPARPFAARFNEALERLQADFDTDRDGEITKEEMMSAPAPLFEQGDIDGDDVLTADEMAAVREERSPL